MEIEAARLSQMEQMVSQLLKTQDHMLKNQEQMSRDANELRARVMAIEGSQTRTPVHAQNPRPASYANAAGKTRPATLVAPTCVPPPRPVLKSLKPGKAVIHSDPEKSVIQQTESGFLVQRANKVLQKLGAKVDGESISIRAAEVLKSGDVCFFSTNKTHQKWLMDNKHIWTKDVHPHLAATPSTFSVIAHGVPKSFNPIAPASIGILSMENNFPEGNLIRIKWLAENFDESKNAGSIVLTFINKETAFRCEKTGVFLNYRYH
jgi:hypothetical protein